MSPCPLLTVHGSSSCTKHTEVRQHLLKPGLQSRSRPLLLALAGGFLECPITGGYFLPTLPSTAQCGHGHGETEEKSEGSLEGFFWVFWHVGISQKTSYGFPSRASWASRQQDTELTWLSWAQAANLSLPQQSAIPAAPRGVYLTCLQRFSVTETPPHFQAICPCTSLLPLFVRKVFLPLPWIISAVI